MLPKPVPAVSTITEPRRLLFWHLRRLWTRRSYRGL